MDRLDLRANLVTALKATHGQKVREANGKVEFRCPRHDDKTPSAWLGDARWGCQACGFTEGLDTLCDALGVDRPVFGLTLEQYAEQKSFTMDKLHKYGLSTGRSEKGAQVVVIPYRDAKGKTLRNKLRGAKGSWWEGKGLPTHLYGLDVLARTPATMPVIVVEGESDCHACWHHAVLAVGVPGANGWRREWAQYLQDRDVYVWQEPDQGGEALVKAVTADFPKARILIPDGVKDLADLHRQGTAAFDAALQAMLDAATPAGDRPPVPFDRLTGRVLERLAEEKARPVDVVPTPLPIWNAACRGRGGGEGLARGWNIVLAGNTGSGKSLAALNVAGCAVRAGERVGILSLEMDLEEIATRSIAIITGTPAELLEPGRHFDAGVHREANAEMDRIYAERGGSIFVNRDEINRIEDIEAGFRYLVGVQGCRLIITDYLQLAWVKSAKSMLEAIQEVSHVIRGLAKSLRVTSLALSQFNRETSINREVPPTPQGLMGGSPLENDAVQVLLLDHSRYERTPQGATTYLLLAKNRHGPAAEIPLAWDYKTLTMTERYSPATEEV